MTQTLVQPLEARQTLRGRLSPHVATLVAVCVLAIFLLSLGVGNTVDLDLFHQMALCRAALRQGRMPITDVFAYTSDMNPSVHYEWGNGAIAYAVTSAFGATGILALKYLLMLTAAFFTARAARQRGGQWPVITALAPVAIMLSTTAFSTIRAGLFTLLFTAVLLSFLAEDRRGNRWWVLAWLPIYVVWLNIHPGFIVGAGLIAVHWLEGLVRYRKVQWHLIATGAAMLALVLVNPYGVLYPRAIWHAISSPLPPIAEWLSMWRFHSRPLQIIYAVSVIVAAYALLRTGWRRAEGILLVAICTVAAFQHVRHCYLYALVWLSYVPSWMHHTPLGEALDRGWARWPRAVVAGSLIYAILCLPRLVHLRPWDLRVPTMPDDPSVKDTDMIYPAGAVQYLKALDFHGNVMTHYDDGSYVMWYLWPAVKVGMDSRNDVGYSLPLIMETAAFYKAEPSWRRTLERFATDLVLVRRSYPLAPVIEKQSGWPRVYRDDAFELFARPGLELPAVDRAGQRITASFP